MMSHQHNIPARLSENQEANKLTSTVTPKAAPWSSNVTQPDGGGAQARIAQHLSAGAPTSAGLPATLSLNQKNVRGNRPISGQKCIPTLFIRQKSF